MVHTRRSSPLIVPPLPPSSSKKRKARRLSNANEISHNGKKVAPLSSPRTSTSKDDSRQGEKAPASGLASSKMLTVDDVASHKKEHPEKQSHHSAKLLRQRSLPPIPPPKSPGGSHFLRGIQLDSCNDLLSIPSPPSPEKRSRRRLSLFQPLRDLSNDSDVEQDSPAKPSTQRQGKLKRSRKSLCHVPSPLVQQQQLEDTKKPSTITLALEEDDASNEDSGFKKRRKKRQSIVLPSEAQDGVSSAYFQSFCPSKKPPPGATVNPTPEKPPTNELAELRRHLRAYMCHPHDAQAESKEAKSIQDMCGYVLAPPLPDNADVSTVIAEPSTRESKMELLIKMGPELKSLDDKKIMEARKVESITECRVQKQNGHYRYYHQPSGRKISASEYETRYRLMLDEINKIRSQEWRDYFDQVRGSRQDVSVSRDTNEVAESVQTPCVDKDLDTKPSPKILVDSDDFDTSGEGDLMIEKAPSHAKTTSDANAGDAEPVDPSTVEDASRKEKEDDTVSANDVEAASPDQEVLLPLPSRDEASSDPDIARAEQQLWATIDQALETYSREVMAIRAARQEKGDFDVQV